jgi:peptidoglycan/LPS O-acetylase OafA/YrhL
MKSSDSIDALTGLRGLAAWWVVFYHFREAIHSFEFLQQIFSGGYLAVDLFFVLSGFVLAISYGKQFSAEVQVSTVWVFYLRRLARIYPLHLVVMVLFLLNPIAIVFFSSEKDLGGRYEISYYLQSLLLIQNWGVSSSLQWNIPAWSISVEWFASLVFPFLVIFLEKIRAERIGRAMLLVFAACASLFAIFWLHNLTSIGESIPQLGLLRCLLEFFLGMLAGILYVKRLDLCRRYGAVALGAGMILIFVGVILKAPDYSYFPLSFFLVVLGLASHNKGWVFRFLSNRSLVRLGEVSYSTYLVHFFCKDWIKFFSTNVGVPSFLVYVFLVLFLSFLFYYLVELSFKNRLYLMIQRNGPEK